MHTNNLKYIFFSKNIGEVRSVMVVFDEPDTGTDQIAKYKYDEIWMKKKILILAADPLLLTNI